MNGWIKEIVYNISLYEVYKNDQVIKRMRNMKLDDGTPKNYMKAVVKAVEMKVYV